MSYFHFLFINITPSFFVALAKLIYKKLYFKAMKRKVVKQGTSTLTISLPSKWVGKFNLQSGDDVHVEEKDNSLLISCSNPHAIDKKTINASELGPLVNRTILGAYITGHDEIKLISQDKLSDLRRVLTELVGFEMIEEGSNYCILRDISGSSDKEFDNLYRRSFLLLKTAAEESEGFVSSNDMDGLNGLISRDQEVNKFTNTCLRHLNKRGYKEFTKTQMVFTVVQKLEEIGDEYKALFSRMVDENISFNDLLVNIYKDVNNLFSLCYEFSFKHKQEVAKKIASIYSENKKNIQEALKKVDDAKQVKALFHLNSLNEKIVRVQGAQLGFV
jgi:phosphate uptake regulator